MAVNQREASRRKTPLCDGAVVLQVYDLEQKGRSIVGGVIKLLQDRKKNPPPPRDARLPPKPKGQTVGSFRNGLQALPQAIADKLHDKIRSALDRRISRHRTARRSVTQRICSDLWGCLANSEKAICLFLYLLLFSSIHRHESSSEDCRASTSQLLITGCLIRICSRQPLCAA